MTAAAGAQVPAAPRPVTDFGRGPDGWVRREYTSAGAARVSPLETAAPPPAAAPAAAAAWLRLPLQLPGANEFVLRRDQDWHGWQTLKLTLWLPADLPTGTAITVFTKDWDHLWRQVPVPLPGAGAQIVEIECPIVGTAARDRWVPRGHERPWHALTPGHLIEFGLAIKPEADTTAAYTGEAYLVGAWLTSPVTSPRAPTVRGFRAVPARPRVGRRWELRFELDADYRSPFDRAQMDVSARITPPAADAETVRGFYCEDFLHVTDAARTPGELVPYGMPTFRVRYTPRRPGPHTVAVTVRVGAETVELPVMPFTVEPAPPDYRGFVRVDGDDPRFLAFDNGDMFEGLGINVRSPTDRRYNVTVPYTKWRDEGLGLYDRLFPKFRRHGINVVEVWMSSWWLALEWIEDAPGFHGVGHMNQYRAWMLDRIVEWAERDNIYLLLVFNNHGKFGALNDTEWARNPYNVRNGGFLNSCEEFFSAPEAKAAFRRLADTILARWAHSPHILAWKLFTEIDLTGNSYTFYRKPVMADWHREMSAYIKGEDLYRHPITTHWMLSYQRINDAVANLPELDFLTTDAYYQRAGLAQLLPLIRGTAELAAAKGKPIMITEFGGSPHADTMGNLMRQLHLGLWTGFFCGGGVPPLFWWFALVEEKDLYPVYAGLRRFMAGEDRRGMTTAMRGLAQGNLVVSELRNQDRRLVWGFDRNYYFKAAETAAPTPIETAVLPVDNLAPGRYRVEYWDCATGRIRDTDAVTVTADAPSVQLKIPPFKADFAVKLERDRSE